jgi:hypothetical protein
LASSEAGTAPGNDNAAGVVHPQSSSERRASRDRARGYSINIKQVVLAFVIEFTIIGLILTSQCLIAFEQGPHAFEALLFPIALEMVELARVPLAIAVRTQPSWSVKVAAAVGVLSAVVVTSFSLSTIAYRTFDPRLSQANDSHNDWLSLNTQRVSLVTQRANAEADERIKERDGINELIKTVMGQISTQPGQSCTTISVPNPTPGAPPGSKQVCRDNPALKPLQTELAALNGKLKETETGLRVSQVKADQTRQQITDFDDKLGKAEAAYRNTINNSQLHSYTAMLFRKDPRDVSDAEVKTLEWYLVIIPSIAAAFASTLIAITAVRRVKSSNSMTSIPDDAANYLFGPLLAAIKAEARATVLDAMGHQGPSRAMSPAE